ncbi:unnamed protein product [Schistosoma mattheei]|uniref:Uncharacterized protein n=1 Tax=Schistosoma mattheei TaxID=31246 RepID=A0AA85BVK3_9TREM|nr:unnamed protein product [Schistosoma mattheei]
MNNSVCSDPDYLTADILTEFSSIIGDMCVRPKINTKVILKLVNKHFHNNSTIVPCLIYKCYLDNFRLIHQ